MEKIVWNYWEDPPGRSQPPHVALCQEILRYRLGTCRQELVTRNNLSDYLPDIHPNIDHITRADGGDEPSVAIKAGIIRVLLLEKYGGLWIDTDAIVLKTIDSVFNLFDEYEFIGMRRTSSPKKHVVNNFFGSVPGGKIISIYADHLRQLLSHKTSYVWNEVGSMMLTPIVDANLSTAYLYPERRIHPLVAGQQPLYMDERLDVDDVINDETVIFMLFHRIFDGLHGKVGEGLRDYTVEQLYENEMLIGKLFRKALPRQCFEQWRSGKRPTVADTRGSD